MLPQSGGRDFPWRIVHSPGAGNSPDHHGGFAALSKRQPSVPVVLGVPWAVDANDVGSVYPVGNVNLAVLAVGSEGYSDEQPGESRGRVNAAGADVDLPAHDRWPADASDAPLEPLR